MEVIGISGRIAKAFIRSKLTPLLVIASLLLGLFAIVQTPREEEPQIRVPMVDVFVAFPGASAKEVEDRVTRPMEKLLWEIKGVKYVYSISKPGMSLAIVRFKVGEDMEESLVKLYNKLMSNYDRIPQGVSKPLVKPKSIDDVPVLAITLWSDKYNGFQLRQIAYELETQLKQDPDVSEIHVIGGQRRQVRVILKPEKLAAYNLDALRIIGALKAANVSLPSGSFYQNNKEILVQTGGFFENVDDVKNLVVSVYKGRVVYLRDVAQVVDGPEEPKDYVLMGFGPASKQQKDGLFQAVTLAIAKKKGTNATFLARRLIKKTEALKGKVIPPGVEVTITRNYGDTAKEKSDELLEHMFIAAFSVALLIAIALGWREAVVVSVAVPVTLALTVLVFYLYGYTLNRVTLFALIFSIGILVDDAIVIVENIHRHFKMAGVSPMRAVLAVDEVGNPTILATFTVIAALLPMAFVSGLMGPYMRPIPVGASAAMLLSLMVAFIVSPWMSYIVLRKVKHNPDSSEKEGVPSGRIYRIYEKVLRYLVAKRSRRFLAFAVVVLLLLAAVSMVPLKMVMVKMLPFDNKSELQVIIDMPEGVSLERTTQVARAIGAYLRTVPEVTNFQIYAGTAAPFNFNGLVRHYYLRQGSNVADIQVNFLPKHEREAQSHDIAKRIRGPIQEIAKRYGANVKIAEVPPGPPVLSTLVAEVYGPDYKTQVEIARKVKEIFEKTPGVVDVDWYYDDDQQKVTFVVDREKATRLGFTTAQISQAIRAYLGGVEATLMHIDTAKEPVPVVVQAERAERSSIEDLKEIKLVSATGAKVSLAELVRPVYGIESKTIYHKNLQRVVYVIADVAGKEESPVYAILKIKDKLKSIKVPGGYELKQYFTHQPFIEDHYALKWDGEWQITYEVFRDLGIAFAAVLVLIYILVVAWFRHFITPLFIMAPIPLTLVGIMPGHWLFGAFFTATSMIGFIALAGIIVRNSILLIDFIQMEWRDCGKLDDSVVKAGLVRFRPIVLTAAAVVVGAFVILFDPIFQGLAIAMMFGAIGSTALTLVAVPLLYYEYFQNKLCPIKVNEMAETDLSDEFSER